MPMKKEQYNDTIFDIDVYIPEYSVGFECKVFEDAFAPMTAPRVNSVVNDVQKQVQRYYDFGIQHVVLVTNLVQSSSKTVEKALKKKLSENGYPESLEVIHKDIKYLLEWLDEKADKISKLLAEDFVKSIGLKNQEKIE